MNDAVRDYLSTIGRRGGTRSRRALSSAQARAMVARREGRRRFREFDEIAGRSRLDEAPGFELVAAGMRDLAEGVTSVNALLVSIATPRLELLGIRVPSPLPQPEEQLFSHLAEACGDGAHARYNALIRRLVSFSRTAAVLLRAHDPSQTHARAG